MAVDRTWIIGVLADLRTFAERNDLPLLAEELDGTLRLARAEIVAVTSGTTAALHGERLGTGRVFRASRAGARA